ncbi:MAG TPA: ABC transporter permease [Terriglobia bacterium]|nr:ABC transporter permease [Terriglobia bacterium]
MNTIELTSAVPTFSDSFREVVQFRDLLYSLTWRDIQIRYKQAVMGFFWALLMPLVIVGAGVLVRFAFSVSSGHGINLVDISSIALKSLPWAFFVSAIKFGTGSMVKSPNLVTKIYFPREVFPLAAVLASLFDTAISSFVIIVLLVVARVGFSVQLLWVPLILGLTVLFTAALAMFLSCANLFFRDVKYLVDIVTTFGIFFTPVFYDANRLGKWAPVVLLNPIGSLLEALNSTVILHRAPSGFWLAYDAAWAVLGLLAAWRIFDRAETAFAETI